MKKHSTIILDLTDCKGLLELHERIQVAFEFPLAYGKNWSAFYDFLKTECAADKIIIKGEHTVPEELQKHLQKMHEILDKECKDRKRHSWPFSYEIVD